MDATNTLNELNHQAILCNVKIICPVLAPILTNTYAPIKVLSHLPHAGKQGVKPGD